MSECFKTMTVLAVAIISVLAVPACSSRDSSHDSVFTDRQLNQIRAEFDCLDSAISAHVNERINLNHPDSLLDMIHRLLLFPKEALTEDQISRQAMRYVSASGIYIALNQIEKAFAILDEGLGIYEDLAYRQSYYSISQAMTIMFFNYAMYDQAYIYADRALEAAMNINDSSKICMAYASKSWITDRIKDGSKDSSYRYIALARQYLPKDNPIAEYITESYAGHIYATDPDSAAAGLKYLKDCERKYSSILGNAEGHSYMPYNIGRAYATLGKHKIAQSYFRQALEESMTEPVMIRNEVLSGILPYYFGQKMYQEAAAILPEWYETTKLRHDTMTKYGMAYWNAKFQNERKDYELKITNNNLRYSRLHGIMLSSMVIVFMVALIFLIYRTTHLRQRLHESYLELQCRTARWKEIATPHKVPAAQDKENTSLQNEVPDDRKQAAMRTIYERVKEVMARDKPFLSPDFTLNDLAGLVYCNRSQLSAAINMFYGTNFSNTVSEYRVNYFIELIKNNPDTRTDELWIKAGFPSRSSFFRQFKSITDMTPAQYCDQMVKNK